ncbi:radical SAM protein [Parasedimentitalea maritima]|uniref:Radical SAM protein n=2 Tax=Parasedimentitalea maritima TaxID=2578117 RepID=A0A6A4RCN0_9RHOB|nr:radical SAM protein [Zongyanglinia marina]
MSLAAVLEDAGHTVEIFDPKRLFATRGFAAPDAAFVEAWATEICLSFPDLVGFTAYGLSFPFVVATAQAVRQRRPGLPILLGGPHATILAEEILQAFDCFDAVARYECETNISKIVDVFCAIADPSRLSGITFRDGDVVKSTPIEGSLIDMSNVPRPALHLYPIDARFRELPIEAGRGCPYDCTFCSTASFFQRRYRVKPNETLVAEMDWAHEAYGISSFNLNHDLFGLKRETLLNFCDRVKESGYSWSCSMRPDQVDAALGKRLRQAGCDEVYFGFETGSQRLQTEIKKKLNLTAVKRDFAGFVASGPRSTVSFITGFPNETIADLNATLDTIGHLVKLDPARIMAQLHMLTPEPGTELDRTHRDTRIDDFGPENTLIPFPEMVRAHPEIFSVFRHFPGLIPRMFVRQASIFVHELMPRLGYPLVVHLTEKVFDGRLSRFFEICRTIAEPSNAPADRLLDSMWRRLEDHLARQGPPYLREMIRFRSVSALMHRIEATLPEPESLEALELEVSADGWAIGTFSCNVLSLATRLSENPLVAQDALSDLNTPVSIACRRDACGEVRWLAPKGGFR